MIKKEKNISIRDGNKINNNKKSPPAYVVHVRRQEMRHVWDEPRRQLNSDREPVCVESRRRRERLLKNKRNLRSR